MQRHLLYIEESLDPNHFLIEVAKRVFDYANEAGLQGKRLRNLTFVFPEGEYKAGVPIEVICGEIEE
jgi:hypothetical protein